MRQKQQVVCLYQKEQSTHDVCMSRKAEGEAPLWKPRTAEKYAERYIRIIMMFYEQLQYTSCW